MLWYMGQVSLSYRPRGYDCIAVSVEFRLTPETRERGAARDCYAELLCGQTQKFLQRLLSYRACPVAGYWQQ
jgi:hypothetical protein